jgi:putative transposase
MYKLQGTALAVPQRYRKEPGFSPCYDFVVMPDHVHLLMTVGGGMTIERAMQFIKGGFSGSR